MKTSQERKKTMSTFIKASTCMALGLWLLGSAPTFAANSYPTTSAELLTWKSAAGAQLLEVPAYRVEKRLQAHIAGCMAAAGFEYTAFIPADHFPTLRTEKRMEQGVVDSVLATVAGKSRAAEANPNQRYFDSLAPQAQGRYTQRLWDRQNGCASEAYRATYDAAAEALGTNRVREYEEALNSVRSQIEAHPRFEAALASWAACAEQRTGLALSSPDHVERLVREELDRATQSAEGLPLSDLLRAPASSNPLRLNAAAVDSARELETTLRNVTASCDEPLDRVVETLERGFARETLAQFADVLAVLFDEE